MNNLKDKLDYSIIIPAYNEEDYLPDTLSAIINAQNKLTWKGELIVVDNNSTDKTRMIAEAKGAKTVFEPVNQISRARNSGARHSNGKYLIFIDADTIISPELLEAALKKLDSGKVCGGGTLLGSKDKAEAIVYYSMKLVNFFSMIRRFAVGSFIFCLKKAWEDVGGFSEEVYSSEEISFSRVVKHWGNQNKMEFHILNIPVDTSLRKFQWHSKKEILYYTLSFLIHQSQVKDRGKCNLWYERPK